MEEKYPNLNPDLSVIQRLKEEIEQLHQQIEHQILQNAKSKRIIMQLADAVFMINKLGVVIECSVDYGTLTELRKDQLIGLHIWKVFQLIKLEDSLYKRQMDKSDLPLLHQAAISEERSTQSIHRYDGEKLYTQADYFVLDDGREKIFCIAIRDITTEYMQKYHLERNRVRMRMMVKQRTEEYDQLNQELVKLNHELSEQISEKVKAQDELAEVVRTQTLADSEKRFRNIVDRLRDMVMILDEKGRITYVTPSCQTTYGYNEDELIGKSAYSLVHPDDIVKLKAYVQAVLKTEEIADSSYRMQRKNGEWANVKTVTVNMLKNPHIKGYVITCTDVTEQMRAQQRIEYNLAKQQLLNQIMVPFQKTEIVPEVIDNAIAEVGRFADVSKVFILEKSCHEKSSSITYEWCNTGIVPQKERLQQIPVSLFNPWEMDFSNSILLRYPDLLSKARTPKNHLYLKENLLSEDLKSMIVLPLFVNGDLYGYLGFSEYNGEREWTYEEESLLINFAQIISSVFQRQKSEQELLHAKERAEESDKLKSAFLSNVSHEIRTPMNTIIDYSQTLAKKVTSGELQEYCSVIDDNCLVLIKLIDDIIDISKIEAEQMQLSLAPCNLDEFFDEVKTYYRQHMHRMQKDKVELLIDDYPHDTAVMTDSVRLRQIIGNLMDNAVKFTGRGFVKLSCSIPGDGFIHFSITDSGIGIPENQQEVIFKRFRQVEKLRNLKGTGLGLAISKNLARLMGGSMGVKSAIGEGSTFYFTIKHVTAI